MLSGLNYFWVISRHLLPDTIKQSFEKWGIVHYIARSGIHLATFTALWYALARRLFYIPILAHLFIIVLSLFYTWLSFSSSLILRALCNLYLQPLTPIYNFFLQISTAFSCTFSWILLLFYNPFLLYTPDFQLSFLHTALLSLIQLRSRKIG